MISPVLQAPVSFRAPAGLADYVLDTPTDLRQRDRDHLGSILQAVRIKDAPPSASNIGGTIGPCRDSERPAQLCHVLDPPPGPELLPVDEAEGVFVDDNVSRLEIIVHHAAVDSSQISR